MKQLTYLFIAMAAALSLSAQAHHSHSSLSRDDVRVMSGVVNEYLWRSPHVYLKVDTLKEGEVATYSIEMGNPMAMTKAGWDRDTWQAGDQITWQGRHDSDPDRNYMGLNWAETADGVRMYDSAGAQLAYLQEQGREIPAHMLGDQPVEPATMIGEGFWNRTGEGGGRFPPIYGPDKVADVWPFTEAGQAQIDNFTEASNPITECIFNGPPRNIMSLGLYQWDRPDANTITIDRDLWPQKRVIHLERDAPAGEPSRFGHSVGWFESDVLHVETTNFTDDIWALYWGVNSSEQKSLYEKYWLSDDGMMLHVEFTVEDPAYLTEPVTMTHQWAKQPDGVITHAECSTETANFFLEAGYE